MIKHLAVMSKPAIDAILSGHKTIESRFSQKRIAPFGQVSVGDVVYFKAPGKEIVGQFKVRKVISFEGLDKEDWEMITSIYAERISLGDSKLDKAFFDSHQSAKYGTLIFLGSIEQFIVAPLKVKKSDLRGWMVLK